MTHSILKDIVVRDIGVHLEMIKIKRKYCPRCHSCPKCKINLITLFYSIKKMYYDSYKPYMMYCVKCGYTRKLKVDGNEKN